MRKPPASGSAGGLKPVIHHDVRPAENTPQPRQSVPGQLRARRAASWRLPPLPDGRRDPLDPQDEPVSDAELDAWRAAWWHLHRKGLPAVIPDRVLAAARRGGDAA